MYQWLKEHGIHQTRSRPYYKNDQAYVEQKNYTHVRQLLGYERLENRELLTELNELLEQWSLWKNLFCVTMKQKSKVREGSRQKSTHEKTSFSPAQRLLRSNSLEKASKRRIENLIKTLNPFEMRKKIREKENRFWELREALYAKDKDERLALLGSSPLRSKEPKRAKRRTPNQIALVS